MDKKKPETQNQKELSPAVTIRLRHDQHDYLAEYGKMLNMGKAELIRNMLDMAYDDLIVMKGLGVLFAVQKWREMRQVKIDKTVLVV